MKIRIPDAAAMEALGAQLAAAHSPGIIYLQGELGAGKTTLVRGLLRELGCRDRVRSPTYTLVEPYLLGAVHVYHLDLYRLAAPEELEWLGLRDMLSERALLLVEWPEQGAGVLPDPDLGILIEYAGSGRSVTLTSATTAGARLLAGVHEPAATP
ncbi:MAG: tRNA (adenosine(37)-N6)-threonylcarbamoyltransferase complex ATPase subunit type 1 TsaE [Gammaproteobacteria bacterium]